MWSIFRIFFGLGWVSFGGPAAHIGYFRREFVEQRQWLSDDEYAQLVALSQFLPGPGSSQVGFAVGYQKGGLGGAIAAFLGFTLPSIILMLVLAILSSQITDTALFQNIIHGLKLLAVVVVADAIWGMYKNFCKTELRVGLCFATAGALLIFPSLFMQMAVLIIAALVGFKLLPSEPIQQESPVKISWRPLGLFLILLLILPLFSTAIPSLQLFSDFYQAGSLVFGGGHVVLPLLQNIVGDQLSSDQFLTGYAAAQAVPGPMFTFATYIGYHLMPQAPFWGALIATVGVFVPGFLLVLAVLKNWQVLAGKPKLAGAIAGVNAAVVGLLIAALYNPVFTSAVSSGLDIALILGGFYLLKQRKVSIIILVGFFIISGVLMSLF
ncbi:chromate efflux transporter [Vibrio sp. SCSIO 43136]|uniref:chromate efflux transporter n=1 Tax=Vibrio sp. SCSIO 43136 TaxID=2819101 RepID=UPI0020753E5F|nr:chromate efflux transporter [Vibrio sp. SCSIO 43136]USD64729.1 chromate efflux transporter [Vibrio sp. SCSIO 43136]